MSQNTKDMEERISVTKTVQLLTFQFGELCTLFEQRKALVEASLSASKMFFSAYSIVVEFFSKYEEFVKKSYVLSSVSQAKEIYEIYNDIANRIKAVYSSIVEMNQKLEIVLQATDAVELCKKLEETNKIYEIDISIQEKTEQLRFVISEWEQFDKILADIQSFTETTQETVGASKVTSTCLRNQLSFKRSIAVNITNTKYQLFVCRKRLQVYFQYNSFISLDSKVDAVVENISKQLETLFCNVQEQIKSLQSQISQLPTVQREIEKLQYESFSLKIEMKMTDFKIYKSEDIAVEDKKKITEKVKIIEEKLPQLVDSVKGKSYIQYQSVY